MWLGKSLLNIPKFVIDDYFRGGYKFAVIYEICNYS